MKRKAFFICLILCIATASAFAWVVLKYYGTLTMSAKPQVEQGEIFLNGESALSIGDVTLPIVSSADGVNFFNEAGEKVTISSTSYELTGASCDHLDISLNLPEDDPLRDCIRVSVNCNGGGDVLSASSPKAKFTNLTSGTELKVYAWYEGTSSVCTTDNIENAEATPIKLNLLAY